jgi:hypothetical protein
MSESIGAILLGTGFLASMFAGMNAKDMSKKTENFGNDSNYSPEMKKRMQAMR